MLLVLYDWGSLGVILRHGSQTRQLLVLVTGAVAETAEKNHAKWISGHLNQVLLGKHGGARGSGPSRGPSGELPGGTNETGRYPKPSDVFP